MRRSDGPDIDWESWDWTAEGRFASVLYFCILKQRGLRNDDERPVLPEADPAVYDRVVALIETRLRNGPPFTNTEAIAWGTLLAPVSQS